MLVCSVSQLRRRAAIAADVAEAAAALDAPGTGNVVFATLVDDPASVGDRIDAFLGQIMLEAASAAATVNAGFAYAGAIAEAAAAADLLSSSVPVVGTVAETVAAGTAQDATLVPGAVPATWDPATVSAVTLSGGNLVATNTGTTSTNQGAHIAVASGKSTGKYYFECTVTTYTGGAGVGVGVGTTAATYGNMSQQAVGGAMCYLVGHTGTGTIFTSSGGNSGFSIGALTTGNLIGVALDLINRRIWFRKGALGSWDGNAAHDPTNAISGGGAVVLAGTIIPFVTFGSGFSGAAGVAGNVITANFGGSSFVGAVPSGYTAGWI